ncbi:nitrate/nitrite transporter NrtS [Bradyrhizobium erythrophlei]|uniref:nitrate/nitrite transporter NrtS n=1 Tax=Bradyrhizobium erythrophlei TaxID=1437360 RepID=UPI0035EF5068
MLTWRLACRFSLSDGVLLRSFLVAVVVGTMLNLINQGVALFGTAPINWFKAILTYFVPYAVSTYGAVSFQFRKMRP